MLKQTTDRLVAAGHTVSTAESLTGGQLAARCTAVAGSSRFYVGGVIAYATSMKVSVLGVAPDLIEEHGVVSARCAEAMALGVQALMSTTWGLATTGVAGPDGQDGHPPGTVWIAVAGPDSTVVSRLLDLSGLSEGRAQIQAQTCDEVLAMLEQRAANGGL